MRYRYRDGGGGGPGGDQVEQLRSYRVEDTPINFSTSTSLSDLTLDEPQSGRISVDSVDGLVESKKQRKRRSRLSSGDVVPAMSGQETPLHYATEDTPAVFSRNDSLSSLSCDEAPPLKGPAHFASRNSKTSSATVSSPGSFQSHLPRPSTVGRSESSGSSTAGRRTAGDVGQIEEERTSSLSSLSTESLNNTNLDEEDLLADCISSAMPKSKSEHYDLAGKGKKHRKSPVREKSKSAEREARRSTSKSPRNSRLIPGVAIAELKLKPRTSPPKELTCAKVKDEAESRKLTPPPLLRRDTYTADPEDI